MKVESHYFLHQWSVWKQHTHILWWRALRNAILLLRQINLLEGQRIPHAVSGGSKAQSHGYLPTVDMIVFWVPLRTAEIWDLDINLCGMSSLVSDVMRLLQLKDNALSKRGRCRGRFVFRSERVLVNDLDMPHAKNHMNLKAANVIAERIWVCAYQAHESILMDSRLWIGLSTKFEWSGPDRGAAKESNMILDSARISAVSAI